MRALAVILPMPLAVAAMVAASCASEEPSASSPGQDAAPESSNDAPPPVDDAGADVHDASAVDADADAATDAGDPLVFVTSKDYTGAIGDAGVLSADGECQALATAAGLSGTYKAWLSASDGGSAAARFTQKSARPYRLRDGRIVAKSFAALGSTLEAAISITEKGDDIGFAYVWTATSPDGTANAAATDCNGWSAEDGNATGGTGESDDVVEEWTIFANLPCSTRARLYCFEQRP